MSLLDFINTLDQPEFSPSFARQGSQSGEFGGKSDEVRPPHVEIVVDARTGLPRQAGSTTPEGQAVVEFRKAAEKSLYVFVKGVLRRNYLTPRFHKPSCNWLQTTPPRRKMLLIPREFGKTSIVGHGLPTHILIQPKESNIYFPNEAGCDQRIYLIGEALERAQDSLRVVRSNFQNNSLIRAFWPHLCWENPRKQSSKWNDSEIIIPRNEEYPDPSIRAIGVGGAITGAHPTVLIKDDLATLEAANSPVVMQSVIDWHIASRALINRVESLEFIIGTRWAALDIYQYIIDNDPTVEKMIRAVVEDGEATYPELFPLERIPELQKHYGVLFYLLYMNSATNPELVDFDTSEIRSFEIVGNNVVFEGDERDVFLADALKVKKPSAPDLRGVPLNTRTLDMLMGRDEFLRLKYG